MSQRLLDAVGQRRGGRQLVLVTEAFAKGAPSLWADGSRRAATAVVWLFGDDSARQVISLDGFLYLLGNLGVSGQMPIADKGGLGEIGWFAAIRQRFSTPWARHGAVREFAVTGRAIHGKNYSVLVACRWERGLDVFHWAMSIAPEGYLGGALKEGRGCAKPARRSAGVPRRL